MGFVFAIGKKWTNINGFTIQVLSGFGRNFSSLNGYPEVLPRFDVYLGYRF